MEFLAGLTIGFLGSLHCIGMCGPLALTLPVLNTGRGTSFSVGRLLYNSGRVVTYVALGIGVGYFGKLISLAGWQQALSIAGGAAILVSLFVPRVFHRFTTHLSRFTRISDLVQSRLSPLFQRRATATLFLIGLLNGLLPCGFVYVGLSGAATTGDPLRAAVFMAGFGCGTVPAMFGVSVAGKLVPLPARKRLSTFTPALTFVIAILIILRGMNLGIPYVSPLISTHHEHQQAEPECCH